MAVLKLKEFLQREIPPVDYSSLKADLFKKIGDYEEKCERERWYFVPRATMGLLVMLTAVNIFSLLQEILYNLESRGLSIRQIFHLPYFSSHFIGRAVSLVGDNVAALALSFSLILILNRNFLQLSRVYRAVKNRVAPTWNYMAKLPTTAWAMLRRS